MSHTHYDNLKVSRTAPPSVIRAAYKALMQTYHPDKAPAFEKEKNEKVCQIIKASYEVLSDESQRKSYDEKLRALDKARPAQDPLKVSELALKSSFEKGYSKGYQDALTEVKHAKSSPPSAKVGRARPPYILEVAHFFTQPVVYCILVACAVVIATT